MQIYGSWDISAYIPCPHFPSHRSMMLSFKYHKISTFYIKVPSVDLIRHMTVNCIPTVLVRGISTAWEHLQLITVTNKILEATVIYILVAVKT
jgi:hypothetical protein